MNTFSECILIAMTAMIPMIHIFIVIMFFSQWIANIISLTVCIFITMLVYFNQKTRLDRKDKEDVSFGKIFKLSIYARVIFELIETIGVTAGVSLFTGMAWMFISYFEVINFTCRIYASGRLSETKCCKTIGIDLNVYKERKHSTFVRGFSNVICSLGIVWAYLSFQISSY